MTKTVLQLDPHKFEEAASRLRAIAHPMRISIIEMLENNKELNVTQIYGKLKIEQASASHHLNILKSKGILGSRRAGKNTFYFLKLQVLTQIIDCINNHPS
jgi:DNA-binding transcriptional ArsR family regulator